ncbi:MAG: hypothetical protein K2M79_01190 [Muribaculaceae bacterium]|nr:hypothetical protein [Muribaculaceae bacterium]
MYAAVLPLMAAAVVAGGCKSKELVQQSDIGAVHERRYELDALRTELNVRDVTLDSAVIRIISADAVTEVTAARIRVNDSLKSAVVQSERGECADSVRVRTECQRRSTPATGTHRRVWYFVAGALTGLLMYGAAVRLCRAVH